MSKDVDNLINIAKKHALRFARKEIDDFLITKAEGSYIYDSNGRKILDFTSGQMCSTLGHANPILKQAIIDSFDECDHLYSGYLSTQNAIFIEKLMSLLPDELSKVFFLNSGAESNEAAIAIAKMYTGRDEIVAMRGSWVGQTLATRSLTFNGVVRKGYGPLMPGSIAIPNPHCFRCPVRSCKQQCNLDCLEIGFEEIDLISTSTPAAIIVEPIMSGAGIVVPPPGYIKRLQQLCKERDMLMIFDEAQTAFRTGHHFAFEYEGVIPDIVTMSKSLGSGFPLSAVITSKEIEQDCFEKGFMYYTSHANDPLLSHVGTAFLDYIKNNNIMKKVQQQGVKIKKFLNDILKKYNLCGDVRGRGLLIAIEFIKDNETQAPMGEFVQAVVDECLNNGLSINIRRHGGSVIRMGPPLTITDSEIDAAMNIFEHAIEHVIATSH